MPCIAAPATVFVLMLKNRTLLADADFRQHYGFLHLTYTTQCCYWEGVIALQTIGLVVISVFGSTLGVYYQLDSGVALLMTVAVLAHTSCYRCGSAVCPANCWSCDECNMRRGQLCLSITCAIALTFAPIGFMQVESIPTPAYLMVMGVLMVLMNLAHVVWFAWIFYTNMDWTGLRSMLKQRYDRAASLVMAFWGRRTFCKRWHRLCWSGSEANKDHDSERPSRNA
eukprot:GHUV01033342.1.p1 GENE.GHUV01033342.1~~GHUV01033342.1.p1  ORF type:complete len:226 (-),score=24.54 GHUV01033342.1:91-768(-)